MARPRTASVTARCGRSRRGFSLAEILVASMIVGIAVSAGMVAIESGTVANAAGQEVTQATFLAQEIREWTLRLPFRDPDPGDADNPPGPDGSDPETFVDDLDDLKNVTYSPPRDANFSALAGLAGWSQQIALEWRDPDDLTTPVADGASDVVHVSVTVARGGRQVLRTGWLVVGR